MAGLRGDQRACAARPRRLVRAGAVCPHAEEMGRGSASDVEQFCSFLGYRESRGACLSFLGFPLLFLTYLSKNRKLPVFDALLLIKW